MCDDDLERVGAVVVNGAEWKETEYIAARYSFLCYARIYQDGMV